MKEGEVVEYPVVKSREEIVKQINNKKYKVISFAINDLLVMYPFWDNSDLFWLLQKDFQAVYSKDDDMQFYPTRKSAYKFLERISTTGAVNLNQIYRRISEEAYITQKESETIMLQENRLSAMYCTPRIFGQDLFNEAIKSGKKVIITSDSTNSRNTVRTILRACGYNDLKNVKMYISSHEKKTKKYGGLFRKELKELKIASRQMLHIGTDIITDYVVPQNNCIDAIWIPSPKHKLMETTLYPYVIKRLVVDGIIWQSDSMITLRSILSQAAAKAFDDPTTVPDDETIEHVIGILIAFGDTNDILVRSMMKSNAARLEMASVRNLIEHFGSVGCDESDLPFKYVNSHAPESFQNVIKKYMDKGMFEKWKLNLGTTAIETREVPMPKFYESGILKNGTRSRAFLKFVFRS